MQQKYSVLQYFVVSFWWITWA